VKLSLFVHDCFLEIGHSNALIEMLRNLSPGDVDRLDIVSFTSDLPERLFPALSGKVHWHRIPFARLRPVLVKIIFYHLCAALIARWRLPSDSIRISIGVAALDADVVAIQFVHSQWRDTCLSYRQYGTWAHLYKKLFFVWTCWRERRLFLKASLYFATPADFISRYLTQKFAIDPEKISTIYSSVNFEKFSLSKISRNELWAQMAAKYPSLKVIDPSKPICLFVGAWERKGLAFVLNALEKNLPAQIIVVGSPEKASSVRFPEGLTVASVRFTREIPLFYALADCFIFPTLYEPFGLVILEACAMGLDVHVTRRNVGASELLEGLDGVYLYDDPATLDLSQIRVLSTKEKSRFRDQRLERLKKHSWKIAAEKFKFLLEKTQIKRL
jgi:glycosyltransferase involved in cell wall biosynthesis